MLSRRCRSRGRQIGYYRTLRDGLSCLIDGSAMLIPRSRSRDDVAVLNEEMSPFLSLGVRPHRSEGLGTPKPGTCSVCIKNGGSVRPFAINDRRGSWILPHALQVRCPRCRISEMARRRRLSVYQLVLDWPPIRRLGKRLGCHSQQYHRAL